MRPYPGWRQGKIRNRLRLRWETSLKGKISSALRGHPPDLLNNAPLRWMITYIIYSSTSSTSPHVTMLSPMITIPPIIPSISATHSSILSRSVFVLILFPRAVAAPSALTAEGERIVVISVCPMLKEWPTLPEEEHTPSGISLVGIEIPILSLRRDSPARIDTV